jgi:multiple sugar transport system ATP-binding protein
VTSIYVTHDQVEAMTLGNRIAILHQGKLQQVGTPLEVYETPANLFVAAFIGTPPMNFFDATVKDGGTALATSGFGLPVPAGLVGSLQGKDGRKLVVGARPEHVLPPIRAARGPTVTVSAAVDIAEPLGDEVVVHARTGDDALVFKMDPHQTPAIGSTVEVRLELDSLHLFDGESQQRLVG